MRIALAAIASWFCGGIALGQDSAPTTEIFRQAVDKLGPESRIRWVEAGEMGLQRWEPGRVVELRGVLVEWEPDRMVMVRRDATGPTTFPGDFVVGIDVGWKEESFANVHRLFVERQFAEVIREGQSVLKTPSVPRWQQRLIVAEMVQSACALSQWQVAGKIYGYIAQDTTPQLLLSTMPLPWSDELLASGKSMREPAMAWMQDAQPAMQLLGASWLLGGEANAAATEVLKRLSENESPVIAAYARAQLWRTVPPGEIKSTYFGKWVQQRDRMPIVIQAGPTMLLAHRLDQAGDWRLAVAEWLRIASLFEDRYHLRDRAIDRATAACRAAGAKEEADRIAQRYSRESRSRR